MSGKRGTKAPDRWIDMTKFDSIAAAHEATGERALDAIDGALNMLSFFATAPGRSAVRSHVKAYTNWRIEPDTIGASVGDGVAGFTALTDTGFTPGQITEALSRPEAQGGDVIAGFREAQVDTWLGMFDRMVGRGVPFYITPRMVRIAADIAATLEPMPLFPTDVPVATGYLWLGSPINIGEPIPLRVLAWEHQGVGLGPDDPTDHPGIAILGLSGGAEIRDAIETFENLQGIKHAPWPAEMKWVPWETTGWAFGAEWRQATVEEDARTDTKLEAGVINLGNAFLRKFLFVVWRLIREEVAVVDPFRPDRHAARRMARTTPNFGDLQVVRLRKLYDPLAELTDDERGERARLERQWSHRWRVTEHWAWRACGPGHSQRRLVKIESYVKGPEHLPLIEKDRVFSLER